MAQATSLAAGVLPPYVPPQDPRSTSSSSVAVAVGVVLGGVCVVAVVATVMFMRHRARHGSVAAAGKGPAPGQKSLSSIGVSGRVSPEVEHGSVPVHCAASVSAASIAHPVTSG